MNPSLLGPISVVKVIPPVLRELAQCKRVPHDMVEVMALMGAWVQAHKDDALPPADGETSPEP